MNASLLRAPERFRVLSPKLRDDPTGRYSVVQNLDTGLVQIHPIPTPEEDAAFYAQDVQRRSVFGAIDVAKVNAHYAPDKKRQWSLVSGHAGSGRRFLDVGCGYGQTLQLAAADGYHAVGVEMPGEAAQRAAAQGLEVYPGDLSRGWFLPAKHDQFDLMLLSHVVEHLREPEALLGELRAHLAPGGLLVAEVPNFADHMLDRSYAYRAFFWQRGHLAYYTPDTLARVMRLAGFADVRIVGRQRYGVSSMVRWLETGKPGLSDPGYQVVDSLRWMDERYRRDVEHSLRCDAIVALARATTIGE